VLRLVHVGIRWISKIIKLFPCEDQIPGPIELVLSRYVLVVSNTLSCVFAMFFFVLCTLCCQFLWIVHFWLSLRYSLTFMCPVPYVASFSGLSIFDCPFGILLRLCALYHMLPVSLDCPFLIALSVFSNVFAYWSVCTKAEIWAVLYLCVSGIKFVPFYAFFSI